MKTVEIPAGNTSVRVWKGYDMDQLEQCRLVNAVKCQLIKEQITVLGNATKASLIGDNITADSESRFGKVMHYASYGMQAFKYARAIWGLYRNFKL